MCILFKSIKSIIVVTMFASLITGCASTQFVSKQEAFPGMYDQKPTSILVIPAVNDSTAADASDYYSVTIAPTLSQYGYYVMPIEVTNQLLRNEGIQDGRQLLGVAPQKFKEMFGADAVLLVNITELDSNYYVVGGNVVVGISCELRSTSTGETLWASKARRKINTSGDSNSGGLIGAIIATAIKTAMQDYMPVARQANNIALATLPLGKYHPSYNLDGEWRNVDPEIAKTRIE